MGSPSKSRRIEHITPIMIQVYAEYMTGSPGLTEAERRALYEFDPIRQADIASIRRFVESHCDLLRGRVLDFGAGKPGTCRQPQPYRDLVDGTYLPVDEGDWLPPGPFDAILCTQVLQYVPDPPSTLDELSCRLPLGGHLVLSYTTTWDEVEPTDLWRFTKAGMEHLLRVAGLTVVSHERRAEVVLDNFRFPLGYGVVARK